MFGNLALEAVSGYLWSERGDRVGREVSTPDFHLATASATPAPGLSWSGIESNDRVAFMNNLRLMGCPEATIRRIVMPEETGGRTTAVVEESASVNATTSATARQFQGQTMQNQSIQNQPNSGSTGVAGNSGNSSVVSPAARGVQAGPQGAISTALSQPQPAVPFAFQPVDFVDAPPPVPPSRGRPAVVAPTDPSLLALTPDQQSAVGQTQSQFANQLKTTSQNPNDPAYGQQWTAAQRAADEMLRATLGDDLYEQYQLNAARQGR